MHSPSVQTEKHVISECTLVNNLRNDYGYDTIDFAEFAGSRRRQLDAKINFKVLRGLCVTLQSTMFNVFVSL